MPEINSETIGWRVTLRNQLVHGLRNTNQATLLFMSFVFMVVAGAGLLMIPNATVSGHIDLMDAMFTAASAVCVTGLTVVDTGTYFTLFGQIIILALIQIGGLGVMTLSVIVFRIMGKQISFRQRMLMQDIFMYSRNRE
ncbi:MAG: potassium transporter TrkG, partial [Thermodesulfobacteriota bacterium]